MLYFDQAAAMRPPREVLDFYRQALEENFANQEAGHRLGYELRRKLDSAAEQLSAAILDGAAWPVIWGGSGSELFNLIADSPAAAGRQAVASRLEHPALTANLRRTAAQLKLATADSAGGVDPASVPAPETELAAIHLVQSELGRIQDAAGFFAAFPRAVRVLDAIQAAGKLAIPRNADIIVVSGHKFGAPGGGAILLNPASGNTKPFLAFAERYRHTDYRIGRPEASLLLTMAFAAELRAKNRECELANAREINQLLRHELDGLDLPGGKRSFCTVPAEAASPYILHMMFPGLEAGVMVRMLSESGVMAAAGSACSSESRDPSGALLALGFSRRDAWSGLRASWSCESTAGDAKKFAEAVRKVLKNW